MEESCFPRGGSKPQIKHNEQHRKTQNLFGRNQENKSHSKKKQKSKDSEFSIEIVDGLHLTSAELLSYKKIQPSMVVLATVKEVLSLVIKVQLPGTIYADVQINAISDNLTATLSNNADNNFDLNDLFKIGDYVPIQILDIADTEKGSKRVVASINPKDINSLHDSNSFKADMLVWGSVSEKSDHVYSIDLGVQNTRCILNIRDVDDEKEYIEGKPLWLLIKKVDTVNNISTIKVSNKFEDLTNYSTPILNIDHLIPGACVQVVGEKALKDGLEVSFFGGGTGYINQVYFERPVENYESFVGKKFGAYLLYKNSVTKFLFFTLRGIDECTPPQYGNGSICKSRILGNFSKGVLIHLENKEFGFVTIKRLLRSLKAKDDENLSNLLNKTYSKGSNVNCRVLDYSYMDRMYVCTFEADVLKEKYFSHQDLKPGQIVYGIIQKIDKHGLTVRVGKVQCFVMNEDLTNVAFSEAIKQIFKVGSNVKARVWSVSNNSIKLTMKPILLSNDKCLSSVIEANLNEHYLGVVVHIKPNFVLVRFYNDVKGIIINKQKDEKFTQIFYFGQVVKVSVLSKKDDKLLLSVDHYDDEMGTGQCKVGTIVSGTVVGKSNNALEIMGKGFKGFLPANHLCNDSKLSHAILDLYHLDDELNNMICIGKQTDGHVILSVREYEAVKSRKFAIPKEKALHNGAVVRASLKSFKQNSLLLETITKESTVEIVVEKEEILDNEETISKLKLLEGQLLFAKVLRKGENGRFIGSIRMSRIFDSDTAYSAKYLQRYFSDVERVREKAKEQTISLANYTIGQKVKCYVTKISDVGCSIQLSDGAKGIVLRGHMPKNVTIGSNHTGIVLFVNFADGILEISLKRDIVETKYSNANSNELTRNTQIFAKVLIIRENCIVCSIKQNKKTYLGFVPVKIHENDLNPNYDFFRNKNKFKFVVSVINGPFVIGYAKDFLSLARKQSKKRKLDEVDSKRTKKAKLDKGSEAMEVQCSNVESESLIKEEEMDSDFDEIENEGVQDHGNSSLQKNDGPDEDSDSQENNDSDDGAFEIATKQKKVFKKKDTCAINVSKPPAPVLKTKFELPGMKSIFDAPQAKEEESDSESDSDDHGESVNKTKKLTKKERVELMKKEEEEIRRKELEYAQIDQNSIPQNADQFDRRLLADPNSSRLWILYAAFHVNCMEIDKARAVYKRSLETIDHAQIQEHLNIWTSYMILEKDYGTKETFDAVFQEAVKRNDDKQVYINALNIFSTSQNLTEVDLIITKMKLKFKQVPSVYVEIAKVYYNQKRFAEARKLRAKALATIVDTKKHFPLIVQFAKMEFENGEYEYAETLFETILRDAPQRTDVWSVYIDQLVKQNKIDLARHVLQRAVSQKLKIAKVTTLCKKYVTFENKFGNEESKAAAEKKIKEVLSRDEKSNVFL